MTTRRPRGFSLIEATIAVGVFGVTLLTIANFMAATDRLTSAAERRSVALSYAREALETSLTAVPLAVRCTCGVNGTCSGSMCTRTSDAASCTLQAGRTTCWVPTASPGPFHTAYDGGTNEWSIVAGSDSPDPAGRFERAISLGDVVRAGDPSVGNTKRVRSSVSWLERGTEKSVSLDVELTAWQDAL